MAAKQNQPTPTKRVSNRIEAKTTRRATGKPSPPVSTVPSTSSTVAMTTARRMVTRGLGKLQEDQEESSTSNKRKLPSGINHPAPKRVSKTPKKGSISPAMNAKKLQTSVSEPTTLASSNRRASPQKGVKSEPLKPQTKTSPMKGKLESASRALDIIVRHTPSDSIPNPPFVASHMGPRHSYISPKEVKELKQRALKAEKDVIRLKKDQRRLRMQVYRLNKRNQRMEEEIVTEQIDHEKVEQQLKAIMLGVQLEPVTAEPEAT